MNVCTVALVHDQRLFREGLRVLFAAYPEVRVVAEASDSTEAAALADANDPDVVVVGGREREGRKRR